MQSDIHNKVKEAADLDYSKGKKAEWGTLEHSIYFNKASSFENGCFWYDTNICKPLRTENEALKERVKQLEQLERSFYMDICRAYNAGKQCMSDQHEDARNGKEFNTRFVSSHNYFVGEFPTFKTNVP